MHDDIPLDLPVPFRGSDGRDLDLNALLTPRQIATFCMRVAGHGLRSHGVVDGDLLVIDRSIIPAPGVLVVGGKQRSRRRCAGCCGWSVCWL